jgi:hypothetical protein
MLRNITRLPSTPRRIRRRRMAARSIRSRKGGKSFFLEKRSKKLLPVRRQSIGQFKPSASRN